MDTKDLIELNSYIQRVMDTPPAPPEGSADRELLKKLQQMIVAAVALEQQVPGSVDRMPIDQIWDQARRIDERWKIQTGRPTVKGPDISASRCSLSNPGACAIVGLKWIAIGAGIYFGGKWVLGKISASNKKRKKIRPIQGKPRLRGVRMATR
jgi:hypothetical protein